MKKFIKLLTGLLILGVLCTGVVAYGIHDYMLKNTWSTLKVTQDVYLLRMFSNDYDEPMSEIVILEKEYNAHETFKVCDTVFYIDKIYHDGRMEYTVKDGQLIDESGTLVKKGVFKPGVQSKYNIGDYTFIFTVTDSRYR